MVICVTGPGLRRMHIVDGRLFIQLDSDTGGLEAGRRALRDFLLQKGVSARGVQQVELAFEETVTNVIRHAYRHRDEGAHPIDASLCIHGEDIALTVEDDGPPFNPLEVPEPALPSSIEHAKIGGLGLRLVRMTAKGIEYERLQGKNRLTIRFQNG